MSSPLRSPAVLVGVPLATVLATWSTNALLGGVIPSAEEAPLRAESAGTVALDAARPPSATSPSAATEALDARSLDVPSRQPAVDPAPQVVGTGGSDDDPRADRSDGPRVVRVSDEPVRPSATRDEGVPGADEGEQRPEVRRAVAAPDEDSPSQDTASGSRSSGRTSEQANRPLTSRTTTRTSSVVAAERSEGAYDGPDEESAVLDVDTPAGGLSVLSFGDAGSQAGRPD